MSSESAQVLPPPAVMTCASFHSLSHSDASLIASKSWSQMSPRSSFTRYKVTADSFLTRLKSKNKTVHPSVGCGACSTRTTTVL